MTEDKSATLARGGTRHGRQLEVNFSELTAF